MPATENALDGVLISVIVPKSASALTVPFNVIPIIKTPKFHAGEILASEQKTLYPQSVGRSQHFYLNKVLIWRKRFRGRLEGRASPLYEPDLIIQRLFGEAGRLRKMGRLGEAVEVMKKAASIRPLDPIIQHDLGLNYLELGRPKEAVSALRRATQLNPRFALAHFRLGLGFEQLLDTVNAIASYRKATEIMPGLAEGHFRLAMILEDNGHRTEAREHFRKAKAHAPKKAFGRLADARACLIEDRYADAEKALRSVLAEDPKNVSALELLGRLLTDKGRFEEAFQVFETVFDRAPGSVGIAYDLVRCRKIRSGDGTLLDRLRAAARRPGLSALQANQVHLALGKALDDLGLFEEAMKAFDVAAAARQRMISFDLAQFKHQVEALIGLFTPELCERTSSLGSPDITPVLIVGMPRSGTTLVEQVLSCHPDVAAGGELFFWGRRGKLMEQSRERGLTSIALSELAADCLRHLHAIAPNHARVTDKMPYNFLWAGLFHLAFPKAVILHCRRSAIDTALSIKQTFFSPRLPFPTGGSDLVGYYREYERLVEHWRRVLPAECFVDVDYEALVGAPEPAIRALLEQAHLPWDEACLRPQDNDRVVKTASRWQARQPIYRTAVERWRNYEPWLGPLKALVEQPSD